MVNRVHQLEHLDRDTKAKTAAASALNAAGKLVSGGTGISMDDVEGRMRAAHDVADEKFQRAMGSVDTGEADSTDPAVDDVLNSLRPKEAVGATK